MNEIFCLAKVLPGTTKDRNDVRGRKKELFVNADRDDYRLKTAAAAIDAGVAISGYTKSRRGLAINNRHDIGAFEYAGAVAVSTPPSPAPSPSPAPAPSPTPPAPSPSPSPGQAWLEPVDVINPTNGISYQYYEGSYDKLPDFSALPSVKGGQTTNINLTHRQRDNDFGFVFTGYFKATKAGVYTFYTTSDDGSQLFIGTHRVVDNDGIRPAVEKSGSIGPKSGLPSYPGNIL